MNASALLAQRLITAHPQWSIALMLIALHAALAWGIHAWWVPGALLAHFGLFLLWQALSAGYRVTWRGLVGLLLAGWGIFNLVEGLVDHHILTIHHVRDDVADPLWWDLGFLALGAILVIVGFGLRRSDRRPLERLTHRG